MKDKKFLAWIHERLKHQHGENPNYDYMWRLRQIIYQTPSAADSSNTPHVAPAVITTIAEDFGFELMPKGEIVDRKVTD